IEQTTSTLKRVETESQSAEEVIRAYAPSVCLIHVSVAFVDRASGRPLRYGGINPDGEPLHDSDGNPVYTLEGRAPEVRADFFGTGFMAGEGRILTTHHVAAPWWKNNEIAKSTGGKPKEVVNELLRRKLIRPLVTQGHIGDVLPDKIVYDAQTTSGGSGGPLINRDGEVIGVTFAVVKGFGGSNFGVPIRFAQPLLKP